MADELSIDSKALIFATLADVYLSSGMLDEAISILKDGLARNPNYTLAKIILGRAYYMKGETDEALKLLEAIYPEAKDSENENLFLGHCYKRLVDFDKARKHYETVLRINPDNKDAKKEIATLGETAVEVKSEPKTDTVYEETSEIEAKLMIDIKGMDQSVPIKEVVLPEGDITADKETPEPDMVIQEPTLKIIIPPTMPETIDKTEIEIVLPTIEEAEVIQKVEAKQEAEIPPRGAEIPVSGADVPVSWVDNKNEAEAIQETDVPPRGAEISVSGAEDKKEPEVPEKEIEFVIPVKPEEKSPEIMMVESSVSEEVRRRIEALAAANAEAARAEQTKEPEPVEAFKNVTELVKAKEGEPTVQKQEPLPTGKKKKVETKQKAEVIQRTDVPVSGAEVIQRTDVEAKTDEPTPPVLFAEEIMVPEPEEFQAAETGTPFDRLNVPMEKLLSLKTVNAAFIAARDGLLIKNYAEKREDIEEISALVAAIFNEALDSFKFLDEGPVEKIIIEMSGETICVITAGESLLCVITQPEAKPGLIFVYARKIIDEIREVLG